MVAVPPGAESDAKRLLEDAGLAASARLTSGGPTRAESVCNALELVETPLVLVHDAARPLATSGLFDAVLETLEARPDAVGVIAAAALADTVKRAREPRSAKGEHPRGGPTVAKTLSREHLWAAQTPQAFRTDALREAQRGAAENGTLAAVTDEAMLIERAGGKVLIEAAPPENIKVTTSIDLELATALLNAR